MNIQLDEWYEYLVVGLMVVAVILALGHSLATIIMMIIRKGGKLKVGKGGVEVSEDMTRGSHAPLCETYVSEHTEILRDLQYDMMMSFGMSSEMLKALRALLEAAKGDINGNVDDALSSIKKKQKQLEEALLKKMKP